MALKFDPAKMRDAREQARKTPEELAVAVGRSYSLIVKYERGERIPPPPVIGLLAEALEVDLGDLLTEAPDGETPPPNVRRHRRPEPVPEVTGSAT